MTIKKEWFKDYWSNINKTPIPEYVEITRNDRLYSGPPGQSFVICNIGPGPDTARSIYRVDRSETDNGRVRVISMEPVPGDIPFIKQCYAAWKDHDIPVQEREAWVDLGATKPVVQIPVGVDVIRVDFLVDWEKRTITPKIIV